MPVASTTIPAGLDEKAEEINLVLSEPNVDLWKLRALALSEGGLVNDILRRRAWPKLVGLHDQLFETTTASTPPVTPEGAVQKSMKRKGRPLVLPGSRNSTPRSMDDNEDDDHTLGSTISSRDRILAQSVDFDQIERDVARCTWHLLTGTQRMQRLQMEHKRHKKVARLIRRKQRRLANLINLTLVQSYAVVPEWQKLRYFQGYHDVACIFLSTLGGSTPVSFVAPATSLQAMAHSMGLDFPAAVLLQVSQSHFADCLRDDFLHLQTALRLSLFPLLCFLDPHAHAFLEACDMQPFFALSWVITWFAHDIRDTDLVKRLFDVFLVSHPLMPIYLAVAMVLHPYNRKELLETECDFAMVHQTLTGLPRNSSMAGYKYRPGDGYVSDEEEEDEDAQASVSTEPDGLETDFLLTWQSSSNTNNEPETTTSAENASIISSNLSSLMDSSLPAVPFQELIETAIGYMRRIPPRKLLTLATRYHGEPKVQSMLDETPEITLFEGPPLWVVAPSAKADWVMKQRARERRGVSATNRRDRRKRYRSDGSDDAAVQNQDEDVAAADETTTLLTEEAVVYDKEAIEAYLKKNRYQRAVIAAGFGPGDDPERRRRKRKKLFLVVTSVAVVVCAVAMAYFQRDSGRQPVPPASSSDRLETPVDVVETIPVVAEKVKEEPNVVDEPPIAQEDEVPPMVVAQVVEKRIKQDIEEIVGGDEEGTSEQWLEKWMEFLQETDPEMTGVPFLKNAKQAFQGLRQEMAARPVSPAWGDFVAALKTGVARETAELGTLVEPGLRSLSRASKRFVREAQKAMTPEFQSIWDSEAGETTYIDARASAEPWLTCPASIASPLPEESANFLFSRKRDFLRSGMNPSFSAVGKTGSEPITFHTIDLDCQSAAEPPPLRPPSRASMHVRDVGQKNFWRSQLGKLEQDVVVWEDSPAWGQLMTAIEENLVRGAKHVVVRFDKLRRVVGPRFYAMKDSLQSFVDHIRDVLYQRLMEPGENQVSTGTDPTWGGLVSQVRIRVVQSASHIGQVTAVVVGPHLDSLKNVTMVFIIGAQESAVGKSLREAVAVASKSPIFEALQQVQQEMEPVTTAKNVWKELNNVPAVVAVGGKLKMMADTPAIREIAKALQGSSAADVYTEYYQNNRLQVVEAP